jgi:WD40 repeat protein
MSLWKFPTMTKVKQLKDPHESNKPILYMTVAPDGESIAKLAADENLKFWKWWGKEGGRIKDQISRRQWRSHRELYLAFECHFQQQHGNNTVPQLR